MSHRTATFLLGWLCLMAVARTVHANIIGPALLPGVVELFGLLAIPATILASFCERPFVRQAGVHQQALFHCFCANLITTGVGFLLVPIGFTAIFTFGLIWVLLAIALSTWLEGVYYVKMGLVRGARLRWPWSVWGNVASAAVLMAVTYAGHAIETPYRARLVEPYWWPLVMLTIGGSLFGFVLGLHRARKSKTYDSICIEGAEEEPSDCPA